MPSLFHVSDEGPFTAMRPRPSPAGTPFEGREWVWAVDESRLPNYLLPRECPRVCWATDPGELNALLGSPAARVIAVEHRWVPDLMHAGLNVHRLDRASFTLLDGTAGYWVSEQDVRVEDVRRVDNSFAALAEYDVEVRSTPSLWPYVDAVVEAEAEFSAIRLPTPRPGATTGDRPR